MNEELKLTIILPVYNGEYTLERTLNSIVRQKFQYPYEVLIINDNSQDNSLQKINLFVDKLPINLINVDLPTHCAGNSRNIGLDVARGEWVTFIDQDDEFEDNALNSVIDIINANNLQYVCCTVLYEYDEDTDEIKEHKELEDNIDVWLHGKYYNRKNLLDAYSNIRFKKDLRYLEDLYFNNQVLQVLFSINVINKPTFIYYTLTTYKWYDHSRSTHHKKIEDRYIFNHWGIANHYCDVVFPSLIEMHKTSKNLESDSSLTHMAYADLGYLYVNYNILCYNYGVDDFITKMLLDKICEYLPTFLKIFKIKNIFDLVYRTIDYTFKNSGLTDSEIQSFITMTFPAWWNMLLTKCSMY